MDNSRIAANLTEVADLLEIQGANAFRIRAYRNAARFVQSDAHPMQKRLDEGEDLTLLPNIGREMASHIRELVECGRLSLLDELGAEVPRTLVDVVALPGLGPKRAVLLWRELAIETVEGLEKAAREGSIARLPGFGRRSEIKILSAIARAKRQYGRLLLADVDRLALPLVQHLRELESIRILEIAGSFRRRKETVGDLDLLVVAAKPEPVMKQLTTYSDVAEVWSVGETRATVYLRSGLQVDLRVVPARSYGAALVYFTGSKPHNIKLRQRAIERGLTMSEYGVFRATEGDRAKAVQEGEFVAGKTEKAVYRAVGLPFIPPELREDRGEIEAATAGRLPRLLEVGDLRGDLQMHSTWSDGKASIEEMVEACAARGYEYLAITDHSPLLKIVNGLDGRRLSLQKREIEAVQNRHPEISILRSQEVDVLADGELDQDEEVLQDLDLVVAAIHSKYDLAPGEQTRRILKAVEHPAVHILAHPTSRKINRRRGMTFDLDTVLESARENNVAVELNALPARLDLRDTYLMRACELGVKIVISTDAHSVEDLGHIRYGVEQARRAWLGANDVLNTLPLPELLASLA